MRVQSILALPCDVAAVLAAEQISTPINNGDVRVLSVIIQSHQPTKMHQHTANCVMIYRGAGVQRFRFQDGRKNTLRWRTGDVKWSPAAGMHIAEITSGEPVNIIEIELKKGGAGRRPNTPLDPLKIDSEHYKIEFETDQVRRHKEENLSDKPLEVVVTELKY